MPFTMTHLIISKNIAEKFAGRIKSLPQFYLGTIAPDAVHNRANYVSEYKKASHLITGTEKWGMTTDHDGWKENIITLLDKYKESEHHDFILGYCSHALADLYNNIHVWTPFRLKHGIVDLDDGGYANVHHDESNKLDVELALTYEGRADFWFHLANSESIDLENIVYAAEIDKQKDNILNRWFKDKERKDISGNSIKTYEGEMNFIKAATDFVALVFQENLHFII